MGVSDQQPATAVSRSVGAAHQPAGGLHRKALELQRDGRVSFADLARTVAMSPGAVAERVHRLEESRVIAGYRAVVVADRVGLDILAFVRLRYPTATREARLGHHQRGLFQPAEPVWQERWARMLLDQAAESRAGAGRPRSRQPVAN